MAPSIDFATLSLKDALDLAILIEDEARERQENSSDPDAQQRMVEGAVGRGLKRDVLPLKPTAVTVKFGMNDHSYQRFREDIFHPSNDE